MFKILLKNSIFIVLVVFSADTAFATPHSSRSSRSKPITRGKSGSKKISTTGSAKPNSYYSGITNHEAAAERQKEIDQEDADQIQAVKEGRPIPPATGKGAKAQEQAARKAALDEKRTKLAEDRELKRLEREAKRDERLAAAAERKAKREERIAGAKKKPTNADVPDVEGEISKKQKAKAAPPEPEKLEGF